MMKIGLLGGSFNPPHEGHLHISKLALKKLTLRQIWWIPTAQNPFKPKSLYENYEKRFARCQIITKNFPKITVKKYDEIYTEKLILRLKKIYKNHQFVWLMGADNFENFHRWKNFKTFVRLIDFAVFSRETFLPKIRKTKAFQLVRPSRIKIFFTKKLNISSTKIRDEHR